MKKAKEKGVNLVLAVDAKIADAFSNDANTKFCAVDEIPDGWEGLDIGPKTEEIFANVIKESSRLFFGTVLQAYSNLTTSLTAQVLKKVVGVFVLTLAIRGFVLYFVQLRIAKVNTKTPTTFFSTSP